MITTAVADALMVDAATALLADSYKVALIRSGASKDYGAQTKAYSELGTDEVQGAGYAPGGAALTGQTLVVIDGRACLDFDDVQWPGADIYAVGAVIYSPKRGGRVACVLDFGGLYAAVAGATFVLPMNSPIRL